MKKYLFLILLGCLSLGLSSCEDNRLDGMTPDMVYLSQRGFIQLDAYAIEDEYVQQCWTCKSGIGDKAATVKYVVDESVLTDYNAANGTSYKLAPSACYKLSGESFNIAAKEREARFSFTYYPQEILKGDGGKYAINDLVLPLRLKSVEGAPMSDALDDPDWVMFSFNIKEPDIKISPETSAVNYPVGDDTPGSVEITFSVTFSNPWDINLEMEKDSLTLAGLADNFNATSTEQYKLAPSDAYSFSSDNLTIAAGKKSGNITVSIDKTKLPLGNNIIPVTVKTPSAPLVINSENNVCYILLVSGSLSRLDRTDWSVETSSYYMTIPRPAGNLLDDDQKTYWESRGVKETGGKDTDRRIYLNMGKVNTVYKVELLDARNDNGVHQGAGMREVYVYYSDVWNTDSATDGQYWTQIGYLMVNPSDNSFNDNTKSSWMIDFSDTPVNTQYLKIGLGEGNGNTCKLGEIHVYGVEGK